MRFARTLIPFIFAVPTLISACGDNNGGGDNDAFDNYQDCYNEHHMTEGFDSACAIEICCIDHPIGSQPMNVVCGASAATCATYVTANLTDPNDPNLTTDITSACNFYVVDSDRGSGTGSMCGS